MALNRTQLFDEWIGGLSDLEAKAALLIRVQRLAAGNPGDSAPVGEGVSELRVHVGKGYRAYYKRIGADLVVLCGGRKSTQKRDIRRALGIADSLEKAAALLKASSKATWPSGKPRARGPGRTKHVKRNDS